MNFDFTVPPMTVQNPLDYFRSEVSLRFSNNFVPENGTTTMMLQDFIQFYSGPGKPLLSPANVHSQLRHIAKSQKMTSICLEGFIHDEMVWQYFIWIIILESDFKIF